MRFRGHTYPGPSEAVFAAPSLLFGSLFVNVQGMKSCLDVFSMRKKNLLSSSDSVSFAI